MPLSRADHRQTLIWFMVGVGLPGPFCQISPLLMPFIAAVFAYRCAPMMRRPVGLREARLLGSICRGRPDAALGDRS